MVLKKILIELEEEEKNLFQKTIQAIHSSVLQNYVVLFTAFKCIHHTFNQNEKCSLDKTGQGNELIDFAISAQKFPKIVRFCSVLENS